MPGLRIGTWNLENLFRPDAGVGAPTDLAAYDAKLAALAGVATALDVDVLAVQEVGTPAALDDLAGLLAASLGGTWQTEVAAADGRGIRTGVLSRLPVLEVEQVSVLPPLLGPVTVDDSGEVLDHVGRPALRVRVDRPGGGFLDVVSVHLKSKLLSFPGGRFNPRDEDERARYAVFALHRRAAEAAAVRTFVTALLADQGETHPLVVGGDLNDEPSAATTQVLLGPPGSEIGTGGFTRPDQGDRQRLWNLAPLIPEAQRFSRVYRGRGELIDHLLVSRAVVGAVTSVTAGGPVPESVGDDPRARVDKPGSDHRPVVATLAS